MSQGTQLSRKEKKAQRDAERLHKGRKRKREEADHQEEPEREDILPQEFTPLSTESGDRQSTALVDSRSYKRKIKDSEQDAAAQGADTTSKTPKPKKRRKIRQDTAPEDGQNEAPAPTSKGLRSRFIAFVGNLPYSTTDASLYAHFEKLAPFTVRHRTDPKTKKSKGFAFLEFESYDRMKTCLKMYHHSIFDPPAANASGKKDKRKAGGRRINIELTAGGGGKAEGRKEKIKAKNVRLDEQRKRRIDLERKEKEKKEKKTGENVGETLAQAEVTEVTDEKDDTTGVHPSRLARIKS